MFLNEYKFDSKYRYTLSDDGQGNLGYVREYIEGGDVNNQDILKRLITVRFLLDEWTLQAQNMAAAISNLNNERVAIQAQINILQNMLRPPNSPE